MSYSAELHDGINRMEEHEIVARLKKGIFSEEAEPIAEAILRERGIDPNSPELPIDTPAPQRLGFGWWTFQGWASLVGGTLVILTQARGLGGLAFVLVALNVALSVMLLKYSKIAFVFATVISINPVLWVINGIYIKNRWKDPRVMENQVTSTVQQDTRQTESPVAQVATTDRGVERADAIENTALPEQAPADDAVASDEELWARAMSEADSQNRRQGLWAKCFAEARGVEPAAKARYMSVRVAELKAEIKAAREAAADAAMLREREMQLAQLRAKEQADARVPKGACPACKAVIPLASKVCPKCSADFGPGAAWAPTPTRT